ncbi:MAG: phosphatase PAP2 family protein, partial [Betaproteobacteria bacterium]|nr:phosphatase PAP2 family protein [Betaproteobacteria bacterium]
LDVTVSTWFFDPALPGFTATTWPGVVAIHESFPLVGNLLFLGCLVALLAGYWRPHLISKAWRRRCASWVLLVLVGIGLMVDWALKDHMGRPRPEQIQAFAGDLPFVPALHISDSCDLNCSFVSGHASGAFSLLAWGMWAPWYRRKRWLGICLGMGAAIGLMRIAQGGHFLSDVVFAGWTIWLVSQAMRIGWLRWKVWKFPSRNQRNLP